MVLSLSIFFLYSINNKKKFADFKIFFSRNFTKVKSFWLQLFVVLSIHNPFLGSLEVPHKIWNQSVQPFWRVFYTNRQTKIERPSKVYLYRWLYPSKKLIVEVIAQTLITGEVQVRDEGWRGVEGEARDGDSAWLKRGVWARWVNGETTWANSSAVSSRRVSGSSSPF